MIIINTHVLDLLSAGPDLVMCRCLPIACVHAGKSVGEKNVVLVITTKFRVRYVERARGHEKGGFRCQLITF